MSKTYETLDAWKDAIELAAAIYETTSTFPREELFGIVSQLRRAVISISSNIAEGYGRKSLKERKQFLGMSLGSLNEVESLLIVSNKLGFINNHQFEMIKMQVEKEGRLLGGLLNHISKKIKGG